MRGRACDINGTLLDDFNIRYDDNLIRISIASSSTASLGKGNYFAEYAINN